MIEPQMKTPPADIKTAVTDKYTEAYNLNVRICINAQMAQQNLWEMCKALKEMHDNKLYKELGYNSFESYTEAEVGIKRHQAQKYLAVAELENGDTCHHLGLSKLALLAKLDEPQREEIQQTVNVEEVSVRELKEQIKKLEAESKKFDEEKAGYKERQDKLLKKNIELVEERDKAQQDADDASKKLKRIEIDSQMHEAKIQELEKQIQELENKPRDSYEDTTKIDELKRQLAEAEERHRAELAKAQVSPAEDVKGIFKAHMMAAVDALKHLTQFTEVHMDSPERSIFIEKLENVDFLINQTISKLKGVQ